MQPFHFSSRGSLLIIQMKDQVQRLDLNRISKGVIELDGRTVKVSADVEATYQAMLRTFGIALQKPTIFQFWVSNAEAGIFDRIKLLPAAVAASEAVEFNDSLTNENLTAAMLAPLGSSRIIEKFVCYSDTKFYYSTLTVPSQKGGSFPVQRMGFLFDVQANGSQRNLSIQGHGCEKIPFQWKSDSWMAQGPGQELPFATACTFESHKQPLLARCCAKPGCAKSLQDQIESDKKTTFSQYKNIPAELTGAK